MKEKTEEQKEFEQCLLNLLSLGAMLVIKFVVEVVEEIKDELQETKS